MAKSETRFPAERQQLILERLTQEGRVLAPELAREFATSEDTIRRDLRLLTRSGLCQRTYGGAVRTSPASGDFVERQKLERERKMAIARTAVGLIKPGQCIFLDSGTTNLEIAKVLPMNAKIALVTNAPSIALAAMGRTGVTTIVIGGQIDNSTSGAIGARAIRDIGTQSFDLCFLGVCALSVKQGLCGFNFEDVEFKKALIAQSKVIAAAVTSDKLETAAPFQIVRLDKIDHLILEEDGDQKTIRRLKQPGLSIHRNPTL
jgi:DeoR/GlpR family transcriptional regulator of sugar metabolism